MVCDRELRSFIFVSPMRRIFSPLFISCIIWRK